MTKSTIKCESIRDNHIVPFIVYENLRFLPEEIEIMIRKSYYVRHLLPECIQYVQMYKKYREPEEFLRDERTNVMLAHMYNSMSEYDLWKKALEKPLNRWISDICWVERVMSHPLVEEDGHSGFTGVYCLKIIEYIAKFGWKSYIKLNNEDDIYV